VASLNKPGGNATGINVFAAEYGSERLVCYGELIPNLFLCCGASQSKNALTESNSKTFGVPLHTGNSIELLSASNSAEIDAAFASLARNRTRGDPCQCDTLFTSRRVQLVTLAIRHAVPALYSQLSS